MAEAELQEKPKQVGFSYDDLVRLKSILKRPELVGGYWKISYDFTYHPLIKIRRAIVERGNIRLRWREDTNVCSFYVKVVKKHKGWFLHYNRVIWVQVDLEEVNHPIWDVVRRLLPELEAEVKLIVDPPLVSLEPVGGELSVVEKKPDPDPWVR